jgi:tRNA-modifying protein YgfZ
MPHPPRAIFAVTGADRLTFLQGLLTQDVLPLAQADGLRYGALLTPQGKYLADMFIVMQGGALYLDMDAQLAPATVQRLNMYRLRADVQIAPSDLPVARGLGAPPQGAWADPRHAALGWRHYGGGVDDAATDWDALRVAHCIPQSGIELLPNDSYILEMGLDRLNGVSFRKGCYVGQEVTARMRHKTELKKGLVRVGIDGAAPVGTPITDGTRTLGTLYTTSDAQALAYLRFDWAEAAMQAGSARLHLLQE